MKLTIGIIIACFLASGIIGGIVGFYLPGILPKDPNAVYRDFYSSEVAVSVSPADFSRNLDKGQLSGTLVDLRTPAEYAAGHFVTAVDIDAGSMTEAQLVAAFAKLPRDKPIITYCYSSYCMLSRQVGDALARNGIYAKHLTAGWYEINRDYAGYIVLGSQPGTPNGVALNGSGTCGLPGTGVFGC